MSRDLLQVFFPGGALYIANHLDKDGWTLCPCDVNTIVGHWKEHWRFWGWISSQKVRHNLHSFFQTTASRTDVGHQGELEWSGMHSSRQFFANWDPWPSWSTLSTIWSTDTYAKEAHLKEILSFTLAPWGDNKSMIRRHCPGITWFRDKPEWAHLNCWA